ncbi:ZIP family metal transporter [Patescibacteria group bacterium]|nr:ZIP family metal transporter [Patescibacteria group bacterium]MBU1612905.1 ZIP family metal transporter [Patescibacteria group bacterium]
MNILYYSIIATLAISIISFVGIISLFLKDKILNKIVFYLVAISAGSLMGGAFLHLIPDAIENSSGEHGFENVFIAVLAGFALFFILERILHWRHCHKHGENCLIHPFTYLNLIGDGLHNFIDGVVITAAFSLSIELGIATTIGVIFHEIPQEISDFGVLVYGGFTKIKALLFNFLSGVFAVVGALCGFAFINIIQGAVPFVVGLTAGGFIYISATDLIPELHKESKFYKSLIAFACFFAGVGLMFLLKIGHGH